MIRLIFVLSTLALIAACGPRPVLEYAPPVASASIQQVWVANFRPTEPPEEGQRSPPRPEKLSFEMNAVSVPPTHVVGQVEWPRGAPDAATDFVTTKTKRYANLPTFASHVAAADRQRSNDTVLFVHGYNMTHAAAVYQLAQVGHDFAIPSPTVLFSWPSAGVAAGYIYDRDSVLIARDRLEEIIVGLTRTPGRKITLIGHSMGNLLIMETLRQMELSGSVDIDDAINALFMISPDIDGELFYTQASQINDLPDPSVILAARQDRALRLSAVLTGRTNRLGSQTDGAAVRGLAVSVIDVSDLGTGGLNHSIALTSPAAIAIIKNLNLEALRGRPRITVLADGGG